LAGKFLKMGEKGNELKRKGRRHPFRSCCRVPIYLREEGGAILSSRRIGGDCGEEEKNAMQRTTNPSDAMTGEGGEKLQHFSCVGGGKKKCLKLAPKRREGISHFAEVVVTKPRGRKESRSASSTKLRWQRRCSLCRKRGAKPPPYREEKRRIFYERP